jgi:hypothetical protein
MRAFFFASCMLALLAGCRSGTITSTWCVPLAVRCNGTEIERCLEDGSAWTLEKSCGPTDTCIDGQCVANPTCGDGNCDAVEDCASCPTDCGCTLEQVCTDKHCLNIGHPRLYFNQTDLVRLRELRSEPSHQALWNAIQAWADAHIGDAPPPTENWRTDQYTYDHVKDYLETLVFVAAMTGEAKYRDAAKNWMLSISAWNSWGDYHLTRMASGFAFGYDALYRDLTPEEREPIRNALAKFVGEIYNLKKDAVGGAIANYWATTFLITGGVGLTGIAIAQEYPAAAEWIDWSRTWIEAAFDARGGDDGGLYDGPSYGSLGYAIFVGFLDALERNTGANLFDRTFIRQTPYYFIYMTYNDRMIPFEDAGWQSYSCRPWGEANPLFAIYRVARETRDGYAQWFADHITDPSLMLGYVWKDPTLASTPIAGLPLTGHFPDLGYVMFRSGWGQNDLLFALKSGTSQGHAHPSQNEFGIYFNGRPLTAAMGYACCPPALADFDDTRTHNCLLVDGNGQCQEPGDYQSCPTGTRGKIVKVDDHTPYYRYTLADASAVYTGWSGTSTGKNYTVGQLDRWLRHVVYIEAGYFVMYDEVDATTPRKFDWLLQAQHYWSDEGILDRVGDVITLRRNFGAKLVVKVLNPTSVESAIENYTPPGADGPSHRILVHPTADAASVRFLNVLFPLLTNDSPPAAERVEVGNALGAKVTNGTSLDLTLFSLDGQPVDQYVELGGNYEAADGGSYQFNGTQVRVQFDSYAVLRLRVK